MRIRFTIPAVPVAQPRQRQRGFMHAGQVRVSNYTPSKHPVNAFKATCRLSAKEVFAGPPLSGPLCLSIVFVLPRPKNMIWKTKPMPRAWHIAKPDSDNLEKALKDALTKLVWVDDSQVCSTAKVKCYAAGDEAPHVEVLISELETLAVPSSEPQLKLF